MNLDWITATFAIFDVGLGLASIQHHRNSAPAIGTSKEMLGFHLLGKIPQTYFSLGQL